MKLILCLECHDVVKMGTRDENRYCLCGKSWGRYRKDGKNAVVGGQAVPVGLDNITLAKGVRNRPKWGEGPWVTAWVFPERFERIKTEGAPVKPKRVALRMPSDLVEWADSQKPELGTTRNAVFTALFQRMREEMKTERTLEKRVADLEERLAVLEASK